MVGKDSWSLMSLWLWNYFSWWSWEGSEVRLLLTLSLCLSSRFPLQRGEHCFLLRLLRSTIGSSGIKGALDILLQKTYIHISGIQQWKNRTDCNIEISFQIQTTGAWLEEIGDKVHMHWSVQTKKDTLWQWTKACVKGDNKRKGEKELAYQSYRPKIVTSRHIWRNGIRILGSDA